MIKTLLPNFLTSCNMLCGIFSVFYVLGGEFILAGYCIILGTIFDFLDGKAARSLNATSAFGTYFDAVADFVSFSIAPGVLIFFLAPVEARIKISTLILIYASCGLIRLFRYVQTVNTEEKSIFQGLPLPAAAGGVISLLLSLPSIQSPLFSVLFFVFLFAVSILMVSRIPYRHFSEIASRTALPIKIILVLIFAFLLFTFNRYLFHFLFLIFIGYNILAVNHKSKT